MFSTLLLFSFSPFTTYILQELSCERVGEYSQRFTGCVTQKVNLHDLSWYSAAIPWTVCVVVAARQCVYGGGYEQVWKENNINAYHGIDAPRAKSTRSNNPRDCSTGGIAGSSMKWILQKGACLPNRIECDYGFHTFNVSDTSKYVTEQVRSESSFLAYI